MSTVSEQALKTRERRFEALREDIEATEYGKCLGHDRSIAGGDPTGRYAILTCSEDGKRAALTRASSRERGSRIGAEYIKQGWAPVAFYDLDVVDGEPLPLQEDDIVLHEGERWRVYEDNIEGDELVQIVPDHHTVTIAQPREVEIKRTTLIWRADPANDEPLPVRYDLAQVVIAVVFNTIISEES